MTFLEMQDAVDPVTGLMIRIEVLSREIEQIRKYVERRPEYADWYNFAIQHMSSVIEVYQNQILKLTGAPNGTELH